MCCLLFFFLFNIMEDIVEINGIPYRRELTNNTTCVGCFLQETPHCDLSLCIDRIYAYILIPAEI